MIRQTDRQTDRQTQRDVLVTGAKYKQRGGGGGGKGEGAPCLTTSVRTRKEDISKRIDFVLLGGGEFLPETFLGAALVIKGALVLVAVAVFGAKDVFALAGVSEESDLDVALPAACLVCLDGFLDGVRLRDGDRTRR